MGVNAAVPGATIYEIYQYLRHAHHSGPGLTVAYIGLDLSVFETWTRSREGFDEQALRLDSSDNDFVDRPWPRVQQLLNFDTTAMSFSYLNRQRRGRVPRLNGFYEEMPGSNREPKLVRFLLEEVHYRKVYSGFNEFERTQDPYLWYRELVEFATVNDIHLITYFNPIHARLSSVIQRADALQHLNALKTFIVATHREVAQGASGKTFPIWDFSNLNSVTMEALPVAATNNNMQHFWDASHHNVAVGDLMVRTMVTGQQQLPGFGVRLDLINLDEYLAQVADDLRTYRQSNQEYERHLDFVMDNPRLSLDEVECHPQVILWLEEAGYTHECR